MGDIDNIIVRKEMAPVEVSQLKNFDLLGKDTKYGGRYYLFLSKTREGIGSLCVKKLNWLQRIVRHLFGVYKESHLSYLSSALEGMKDKLIVKPARCEGKIAQLFTSIHPAGSQIFLKQTVSFLGQTNVQLDHVKVMTQKGDDCGLHALKNALIALGRFKGPLLYGDQELYASLSQAIYQRGGKKDEDVSLPILFQLWDDLVHGKLYENERSDLVLLEMQKIARAFPNCLSMLVYESSSSEHDFVQEGLVGGGGVALQGITNLFVLKKKLESEGPFRHVFLIGEGGHWVTIALSRKDSHKVRLLCYDSMAIYEELSTGEVSYNPLFTDFFSKHTEALDRILKTLPQFAEKAYHNLIGEDFERRRRWLEVVPLPEENRKALVEEKAQYLQSIQLAREFFKEAGWTSANHPKEFAALQALETFYST